MCRKIGPGGYQYRSCIQLGIASLGQWLAHLSFIVALTLLGVASPSLACADLNILQEPPFIDCICTVTPNKTLVHNGIQEDFVLDPPKKRTIKFTCEPAPCKCEDMNGEWGEVVLSDCEVDKEIWGSASPDNEHFDS